MSQFKIFVTNYISPKPTLYKYVNNKEELILDLYDSTIDHLVKDTYKLVDSDSHLQPITDCIFNFN